MTKIRKGDEVVVITGISKGHRGTVLEIKDGRVKVAGANKVTKHVKPNPMAGTQGGFEKKSMPIHISNVALYNAETEKADRVGFSVVDGKKVRVYRSNGKVVGAKA